MLVLDGHTGAVTTLAYSPDGQFLASGGQDRLVKLWNPLTGQELNAYVGGSDSSDSVTSLQFSPDNRHFAAGRRSGTVNILRIETVAPIRIHRLEPRGPLFPDPAFVAFDRDGRRFATAVGTQVIEWQGSTERRLRDLVSPSNGYNPKMIRSVAYSARGNLACGDQNVVCVWHSATNSNAQMIHWPEGDILGLTFSPSGEELAIARGRDVSFWMFNVERSDYRRRCILRHGEIVRAIAFTPDGRTLLTAGDDWTVHLWDVQSGEKRTSFNWRIGPILALAVHPDGMTVAVTGRDKPGILIWDLEA